MVLEQNWKDRCLRRSDLERGLEVATLLIDLWTRKAVHPTVVDWEMGRIVGLGLCRSLQRLWFHFLSWEAIQNEPCLDEWEGFQQSP